MQLLEHQAKDILRSAGLPVPSSRLLTEADDAVADSLTYPVVLKSQVPVGGRGKLGGVRLVHDATEFAQVFDEIISLDIKGYRPEAILAEEAIAIDRELYLAIRLNRDNRSIEWLVANRGGIDIEDNAASVKVIPQTKNNDAYETICDSLSLQQSAITPILKTLMTCFVDNDCLLLEINPLVLTKTDTLVIADTKMLIDDNALFRHVAFANTQAQSSIIPLGGTIGVIANGAGMAMSTMDTIHAAGGRPANFLDIGGGTGEDVFIRNLREITHLPGVTSIIINIFAGITRCDDIARGIIAAKREIPDLVPLYIRLEGTNRSQAAKLLKEAEIEILPSLQACVEKALGTDVRHKTQDVRKSQKADSLTIVDKTAADSASHALQAKTRSNHPLTSYVSRLTSNYSPVIIQGITGHHGAFHTRAMLDAGTHIVAGVTPGKGGETVHNVPVYNTVAEAVSAHQATTSVVFVPARFARDAMLEAIAAGIRLIVIITEGIPVLDMLAVLEEADAYNTTIVGPNCPGLIVPGSHKLGIIAAHITTPGTTAIVSRSGTLTYELADALTKRGIGQRIVLGIGGDPIQGTNFTEALQLCQDDPNIQQIIMVGEIGGESEQHAADYAATYVTKPLYGLVVGHSLPPGQQFGHAGAIVGSKGESAAEKTEYLTAKGIVMSDTLDELIDSIEQSEND